MYFVIYNAIWSQNNPLALALEEERKARGKLCVKLPL